MQATSFGAPSSSATSGRTQDILVVLVSVILVAVLLFIAFFLYRRSRQACSRKHKMDEEERLEVLEARAFRPADETLHRAYSPSLLYGDEEKEISVVKLSIDTLITELPNAHQRMSEAIPHPLFHPGLKRSRTLSYDAKNPRAPHTPTTSYIMSSRTPRIHAPTSPTSPGLRINSFGKESKFLSPYTTMQTRRPQTSPSVLPPPPPTRKRDPVDVCLTLPLKSVWSSPTASIVPSSPSVYSEAPTRSKAQSLSPRPSSFGNSPTQPITPPQTPSPVKHAGGCPLFALDKDDCPPPLPIDPSVQNMVLPAPSCPCSPQANRASTPISPQEPRPYSPVLALPKQALPPKSRRPSLAELNAMNEVIDFPLGLERLDQEVKIERWLEGSTGTVSAFGSVMGQEEKHESHRLSPIKSMRPSRGRRSIRD